MMTRALNPEQPILVTGGAGYIGSHLVRLLLAQGARVRVLDSLLYGGGGLASLAGTDNLEMIRGDIRDVADMRRAVRGVRGIIALAALVGDPICETDPGEAYAVNFDSTRVLGETARAAGVRRIVFASSCSVYGSQGDTLVGESCLPVPVSVYAKTRLLSEQLLVEKYSDLGPVILRLATVFGLSPRMRFDLVVNTMTAHAVADRRINVLNGKGWRPFLHARDAARAFVDALNAPHSLVSCRRFNVGANCLNCTIEQVAGIVADAIPGTRVVAHSPNGDLRSYRVSFGRVRQVLSFEPNWTVGEGVAEVARALIDGTIRDYRQPIYDNHKASKQPGQRVGKRL